MEGSTSDVSSGGEPTDGSIPFYSITNHHNNNDAHAQSTDVVLAQKSPSTMVFVSPTSAVALRLPIHHDSAPFAEHDGDFAWTDEHAPLPPSVLTAKRTTLAPLCHDVLAMIIADFCDEQTARVMMATCRTLRYFGIAMDPVIWRPKCIEAWAGKMRFDPTLWRGAAEPETVLAPVAAYPMSPASIRRHRSLDVDALTSSATDSLLAFTQLPTTLVVLLRRAIKLSATPTPEHLVRHAGCSWRAAYHIARKDARRNFLTDDEVLEHRWEVEFLRRNPAAPAVPPPSEAVFVRDGLAKRVQPAPFLPFVPWQLHDSGRKVQVDVYPAHRVRRLDDTWGWSIENAYVRFYSVLRPP